MKQLRPALVLLLGWAIVGIGGPTSLQAMQQSAPTPGLSSAETRTRPTIGDHMTRAEGGAQPAVASTTLPAPNEQARPLALLRTNSSQALPRAASDVPVVAAAQQTVTDYFIEDFEDNWTDPSDPKNVWRLYDYSDYGGQYLWGKRTCTPIHGAFAAFSAGGGSKGSARLCSSNYPKNWYGAAIAGPLDFTDYIRGTMTYYVRGKSEWSETTENCEYDVDDVLFVGAGPDTNSLFGTAWCGDFSDQFYPYTIDLATLKYPVLRQANVYLSLEFSSDGDSKLGSGFAVDYIELALERPVETAPGSGAVYLPITSKPTPVKPTPKCPDTEPANNTSTGSGTYTAFGQYCTGNLQNDTLDWYKFSVAAGKTVVIDLTGLPAQADYDIYIFDAALKDVARGTKGAGQNEQVTFASKSPGLYYARISVAGANTSPYTYNLRVSAG